MRVFNLQAPKFDMQVNNFLSYRLAEQMGILSPRSGLVSVTLNGKRIGTHVFVEQLEEMTLRHRLVMPGDIYRGEIVGKDKYLISGYGGKNLFDVPGFWDKMAINNHFDESDTYPLQEMIAQVNNTDFNASHSRLNKILDMEAWGRFSAYESLTNTYHFDNVHNWRLYYDPWRQKLVPIVWDSTGWMDNWRVAESKGKAIAPQLSSRLHEKLFQNGDFIRARNSALQDFFESGGGQKFIEFSNGTIDALIRESKYDPYLRPASEQKVKYHATALGEYIERVMREGTDYTSPPIDGLHYGRIDAGIRLSVGGQAAVKRVRILLDQPLTSQHSVEAIISVKEGVSKVKEKHISLQDVVRISNSEVIIDTEFLPNTVLSGPGLLPRSRALTLLYRVGDYDINLRDPSARARSVWVDMGQGWQEISKGEVGTRAAFENLYNPVKIPTNSTPLIWQGTEVITGVVEIDRPLIVKAGTKVLLGANASLILRNKLDVQGTKNSPVVFTRKNGQALPWGTIALLSNKANQSNLSHCLMAGGSGYKGKLFEYSGMLSVHDVQDMRIDNCLFKNGTVVDDMVHIVYSSVDISNTVFDTSFSDALDIDISDARLNNVTFVNSGNDAVDLMSSTVSIINSNLSDSGDKGVSVGEGSRLLAVNNVIVNNEIGIQVKDGSKAFLYNQTIRENVKAIDAYKKNWRYNGGGEVYAFKSILAENKSMLSSDRNSTVVVFDSFLDAEVDNKKWINIYASDQGGASLASSPDLPLPENMSFTQENQSILGAFDESALNARDYSQRGAN